MKHSIKKIKYFIESLFVIPFYKIKYSLNLKTTNKVVWDKKYNNYGDILTPYLLNELSSMDIERIGLPQYYQYKHYFVIGSILDRATKYTEVWGSGFIDGKCVMKEVPNNICAVRGPLTRKRLLELGIKCPEVYGDPALLLPLIYKPKIEKRFKLGIIPHYVDKQNVYLKKLNKSKDIKIIDIQVHNPLLFIDELLSCNKIASSSLHGIITADAYGIQSSWLEFSSNVKGEGFKFYDYFLSVGRKNEVPLFIDENVTSADILASFSVYDICIDLDKLLESCPFKLKNEYIN